MLLRALGLTPARYTPRHRKPSRVGPVLVAGGLTATLAVADGALLTGGAAAAAPDRDWDRLAQCESGGNWAANTGNGYYGGLQFNVGTWRGVGGSGLPSQASRSEQIRRANLLHDQRGFAPWPACSRKLGLSSSSSARAAASRSAAAEREAAQVRAAERARAADKARAAKAAARRAAAQEAAARRAAAQKAAAQKAAAARAAAAEARAAEQARAGRTQAGATAGRVRVHAPSGTSIRTGRLVVGMRRAAAVDLPGLAGR